MEIGNQTQKVKIRDMEDKTLFSGLVLVDKAIQRILKAEIKRTGVTIRVFFEERFFLNDSECPDELTYQPVSRWLNGEIDYVPKSHIDYVLRKFSELKDNAGRFASDGSLLKRGGRFKKNSENWILVTKEMSLTLRSEFARTGFDHDNILINAADVPARLNARIIKGWLYNDTKETKAEFWEYVIERLKAMPNRTIPAAFRSKLGETKPRRISLSQPNHRPISDTDRAALRFHRERTKIGGAVLLRGAENKPKGLSEAMISQWITGKTRTAQPEHIAYVLALYEARPTRQ